MVSCSSLGVWKSIQLTVKNLGHWSVHPVGFGEECFSRF